MPDLPEHKPERKPGLTQPEMPPAAPSPLPVWEMNHVFVGSEGLRAGWSLLLYLALLFALYLSTGFLLENLLPKGHARGGVMEPRTVLVSEGAVFFCVAAASWIMAQLEGRPATDYGMRRERVMANLAAGAASGLGLLTLLVFALHAAGYLAFDGRLLAGSAALRYGVVWAAGFLLVGLFEEYFFRGYMQFTLTRGLSGMYRAMGVRESDAAGFWSAAAVISVGFGATHRANAGESPIGLLSVVLIGLVLCFSLWRTGSLWWAVGFHAAWDWAQSFLFGVPDSGNVMRGHLLASHPVGGALLSGGLTGPEGSVFVLAIVPLTVGVIVWTRPQAPGSYLLRERGAMSARNREALRLDLP